MNILELKKHRLDGEPHAERDGNSTRIKAAHRLPTSGYEYRIALWLIALFLALYMLISEYGPDMVSDPEANFLLEFAAFVVMALSNAFEALAEVARAQPPDIPLENLRGWLFALYCLGGAFVFLNFGPYSLFTWLTNRERVTVTIDDETVTQARQEQSTLAAQIKDIEGQIEALLDRIVDATSPSVIQAYEKRIDKLEREKIKLGEQAAMKVPPKGRLEEFIEHALTFLGNPWKLYENSGFAFKRAVLKLAFAEPLRYSRDNGYRTAKITFPFKVLADISTQKCGMVEPRGIEPLTSSLRTTRSPN